MAFMDRARSLYQRGDAVRAAFVLAEGIKRNPHNEEAVHRFLQIYVEDLEQPGLEQELVRVVKLQPNASELLELVCAELRSRQQFSRLTFLNRVTKLRERAARAREQLDDPPTPQPNRRRTRHSTAPSADGPDDHDLVRGAAEELPKRRRQRRRRNPRPDLTPQGVLDLEAPKPPAPENWGSFEGVSATERRPPVLKEPTRRKNRRVERVPKQSKPAPPKTELGAKPERRKPKKPAEQPRVPSLPPTAPAAKPGEINFSEPPIDQTAERMAVASSIEGDDLGVAEWSGEHDSLAEASGTEWQFGDFVDPEEELSEKTSHPVRAPLDPEVERRIRSRRTGWTTKVRNPAAARFVRGAVKVISGRRGLLLLVFVAGLGVVGAGYRACSGVVQTQLAEADQAIAAADGDSLQRAVELLQDNVSAEHTILREHYDFATSLLMTDYGISPDGTFEIIYAIDEVKTEWGAAALALNHLALGELAEARAAAQEGVQSHPEAWLTHWVRGRIALEDADWSRAAAGLNEAHQMDQSAILPIVGLLDLALRSGNNAQAESLLHSLRELNPEHPMVGLVGPLLAFEINPLAGNHAPLDVVLPNPEEVTLSLRETEFATYIRARQYLAAGRLDGAILALRQVRTIDGVGSGVRVNLLDAVVAAGSYQLDFSLAALERAKAGVPEGSPASATVESVAVRVLRDLGRPDLAIEWLADTPENRMEQAELFIETGNERGALRLLGQLMEESATQRPALRVLVDYHFRRGVPDRARMRAAGLPAPDQHYAAARIALEAEDWQLAREEATRALQTHPNDLQSLQVLLVALTELGVPEQAIELIDRTYEGALLTGAADRMRLQVLVLSGRAPRDAGRVCGIARDE